MRQFFILIGLLALSVGGYSTVVIQEHIAFASNSFSIDPEYQTLLESLIPTDQNYLVEKIDIEGHCDFTGNVHYNLMLSRQRAVEVYDHLARIYPDRGEYEIRYVGENHPVSINDPDQNRCVVVTVYLLELNAHETRRSEFELFPEEFQLTIEKRDLEETTEDQTVDATVDEPVQALPEEESSFIPLEFEENTQFRIENIYFHGNSREYKESSTESLNQLLGFLHHNIDVRIKLEGHVNGRMGGRYLAKAAKSNPERREYKNAKELSLARAESVKRYLVDNGIDPKRIECVGMGGSDKLYKHPKNSKEHEANRRIQVVILNK